MSLNFCFKVFSLQIIFWTVVDLFTTVKKYRLTHAHLAQADACFSFASPEIQAHIHSISVKGVG
jgi:hypothetical protein